MDAVRDGHQMGFIALLFGHYDSFVGHSSGADGAI
jgi:hypothetical protein